MNSLDSSATVQPQQQTVNQPTVQTQPSTESQQVCPFCHIVISPNNYFCPNCGKKLKEKPLSTSLLNQLGIYLLSALLPPLGLWPAFRYLRQKDEKAKMIGLIAIILTVISTIVTLWISVNLLNSITKNINDQLNMSPF